jgi:RNA polymerase sigma-70 factor (ECF subfamily)
VLRFQEGLAYEEIAEITGLPLGTVKTHLHRARKAMVRTLTAEGWGLEGLE